MMALDLTVEALPLPIGVSSSLRQVPEHLANCSKQNFSRERNTHLYTEKRPRKMKEAASKTPPIILFSYGTPSDVGPSLRHAVQPGGTARGGKELLIPQRARRCKSPAVILVHSIDQRDKAGDSQQHG